LIDDVRHPDLFGNRRRNHVSAGFLIAGGPVLRGAAGFGAAAACAFAFLPLRLSFFVCFFFLSAADFDLSSRNSAFSFFICFFSVFLRASNCLSAMSIPGACDHSN
jgi:hypothetical protein